MKIAMIVHGVGDQSLLGGPGHVATEQAKGLVARGHDVRIVTTDLVWKGRRAKTPTFDLVRPFGPIVQYAKAWSFGSWPGSVGPIISPSSHGLIRQAVDWADLIHGHEWAHATVQRARRLCHALGKPFVVQPHGSIRRRSPGWKNLMHQAFNLAHSVRREEVFIALSPHEAADIAAVIGKFARIYEILNPMAVPPASQSIGDRLRRRAAWGCPPSSQLLLYAHRLAPNKGLDIAIEALSYLPHRMHLVVVGPDSVDPGFTVKCEALTHRLGVTDRVKFLGASPRDEMIDVISACDVFVLPARYDTFPMSVLQALACGRPTVITSTCQSADALAGAVVVAKPDPMDFARKILTVDTAEAARLSAAGNQLIANRFAPNCVAERLEAIYQETIDLYPSRMMGFTPNKARLLPRRLQRGK